MVLEKTIYTLWDSYLPIKIFQNVCPWIGKILVWDHNYTKHGSWYHLYRPIWIAIPFWNPWQTMQIVVVFVLNSDAWIVAGIAIHVRRTWFCNTVLPGQVSQPFLWNNGLLGFVPLVISQYGRILAVGSCKRNTAFHGFLDMRFLIFLLKDTIFFTVTVFFKHWFYGFSYSV